MPKQHIIAVGKVVRFVTRLRGGGSALPGLVIEKIDPDFTRETLSKLPHGVIVISGTNGKTTTTKIVVELLRSQGLKVFTNRTGSNFVRGVIAAILADIDIRGNLDADIAVLELDEAHAVKFVDIVPPSFSLLLNVMRDQLDRFGEIDKTAQMLEHIAKATTKKVVLNREDQRVAKIAAHLPKSVEVGYFGLAADLLQHFPSDDSLRSTKKAQADNTPTDVCLQSIDGSQAVFSIDNQDYKAALKLNGIYNTFNAAAALALVRAVVGSKVDNANLLLALEQVSPAFGRGESLVVNGQPLELVLVKNPSGFRLALKSFPAKDYATMIAINDNYADGRDMSWLWDVNFSSLKQTGVAQVSGVRAYDMALRLQYDEVEINNVDTSLEASLAKLLSQHRQQPKRIYCTYTAMLALRKQLSRHAKVEQISWPKNLLWRLCNYTQMIWTFMVTGVMF